MTFADATQTKSTPARPATAGKSAVATASRDIRLDFFRGIAMFIILMAHTPGNAFTLWIPARWGFSDATEIFVFCSGMASAIAFGRTYDRQGWRLGTGRVAFRVWQVYWAHIGLFCATAALTVFLTELDVTGRNYWGQLNLWPLFVDSDEWSNPGILLGLMTLRYVPNYFDILPMYLAVLVLLPVVMALAKHGSGAVAALVVLLWLGAQGPVSEALGLPHLAFPAEPWSGRTWFFNPFGWQLVFFTGFALMRGWLPRPPVSAPLMMGAAVIVIANIPLSDIGIRVVDNDWASGLRSALAPLIDKSDFGILRYLHFLALAYLAWAAAGEAGARLRPSGDGALSRVSSVLLHLVLKVGQQSLAVFVVSMFTARLMGFAFDVLGRDAFQQVLVNLAGAAILVATAYLAGWFKSQPWRQPERS